MKLYLEPVSVRLDARAHLLRCLRLYLEACAQLEAWDAAIDAGLKLAEMRSAFDGRPHLSGDEVEILAFGQAERATWLHRMIRANRLLASAQGIFEDAHRPALPMSAEDDAAQPPRTKTEVNHAGERAAKTARASRGLAHQPNQAPTGAR